MKYRFFDRDLSWLTFNDRILDEAGKKSVPLMERIRFLAIYASNLDEFYRVRIPVINALNVIAGKTKAKQEISHHLPSDVNLMETTIKLQQQKFVSILTGQLLPLLQKQRINLIYGVALPAQLETELACYFCSQVLGYLHPVILGDSAKVFFPENNKLYQLVILKGGDWAEKVVILNIPSDHLPRFFTLIRDDEQYIVFMDDIIRNNLNYLFPDESVKGCYSFKVTRDAELDLQEDYGNDISVLIEKQLLKRDQGLATRLLYELGIPSHLLKLATEKLGLRNAGVVAGGRYHNLRDLFMLPVKKGVFDYEKWPAILHKSISDSEHIWEIIAKKDLLICTPYHSYDPVLRFFNEAATHPEIREIYTSIYRVASDSRIAAALVTAARNGKKVQVLVELKARFDEANNIKWAKQMKQAGVTILYSSKKIKVHAKVAVVKKRTGKQLKYFGLLATGNFNEGTAAFYTDFILMTAAEPVLRELEVLFELLSAKGNSTCRKKKLFNHLLVAGFNLKDRFIALIDREIAYANSGLPAAITIKLNNLQERDLISKLYDASCAGVKISLIVRSICCIVPGVAGISANISVTRIVGRFLEHSRVFIFNNNNDPEIFLGSADWMNRNIYHRIEVCFPVIEKDIKEQLINITAIQLADNSQAVMIDDQLNNIAKEASPKIVQSQLEIYRLISADN